MKKNELENLLYIALRFKPEYYGLNLDPDGWMNIDVLIYRINFLHGQDVLDKIGLYQIAKNNPRFSINVFKTKIKANVVDCVVDETIKKTLPPDTLYYISQTPIKVHNKLVILPEENAKYVVLKTSLPYGINKSCVLRIDSRQMSAAGYKFYLASNGDFLTERVSVKFIRYIGG